MQESEAISPTGPTLLDKVAARWKRDLAFFLIAAAVVALDQFTKELVRDNLRYAEVWDREFGPLRIIHVWNSGAAFGILQGQTPFLIVMSIFGLGAIALYYVYPPMDHGIIRVALGMQLGGAVGNLIDRVRLGHVTDFIDVGDFPTFNVADSCISISITIVLGFFFLEELKASKARAAEDAAVLDAGVDPAGDSPAADSPGAESEIPPR
jgi:signal peptidase II